MVFTTLSSSAREVFSRLAASFPLVLIDEAAQAAEVASLQPLVYGARWAVEGAVACAWEPGGL
jgi:superfamily I DNA and/or RNA helicase